MLISDLRQGKLSWYIIAQSFVLHCKEYMQRSGNWKNAVPLRLCLRQSAGFLHNAMIHKGEIMMIKQIGHLALTVEDMKKSLYFYCDVLGFERAFDIKDDNENPWIEYIKVCDGQFIELFYGGQHKPDAVRDQIGFNHLCLEVRDIFEIAAHLKSFGIKLDVEPVRGKDHNYQCWVRDPDGNRIEFMQLDPESPHMNC